MLSASEIKNHEFRIGIGYSKRSVDNFMSEIAKDYEELYKENLVLKDKAEALSEGLQYYKSIEKTLQKSLVLAQRASDEEQEKASKKAQVIEIAAHKRADEVLTKAKLSLDNIFRQTDDLNRRFELYKTHIKNLITAQLDFIDSDAYNISVNDLEGYFKLKEQLEEAKGVEDKNNEESAFISEEETVYQASEVNSQIINESKDDKNNNEVFDKKTEVKNDNYEEVVNEEKTVNEEKIVNEPKAVTEEKAVTEVKVANEANVVNKVKAIFEEKVVNKFRAVNEERAVDEPKSSNEKRVINEPKVANEEKTFNEAQAFNEEQALKEAKAFNESLVNKAKAYNEAQAFNEEQVLKEAKAFNESLVNKAKAFNEAQAFNEEQALKEARAFNESLVNKAKAYNEAQTLKEEIVNKAKTFDEAQLFNEAQTFNKTIVNEAKTFNQEKFINEENFVNEEMIMNKNNFSNREKTDFENSKFDRAADLQRRKFVLGRENLINRIPAETSKNEDTGRRLQSHNSDPFVRRMPPASNVYRNGEIGYGQDN